VRGAPASTMVKACLFALAWDVVIALLPRDPDSLWVSIVYALMGGLFPVIVAVNMGYQSASRKEGMRPDQERLPIGAVSASVESLNQPLKRAGVSDAITPDPVNRT
jgi:hypothetical protein